MRLLEGMTHAVPNFSPMSTKNGDEGHAKGRPGLQADRLCAPVALYDWETKANERLDRSIPSGVLQLTESTGTLVLK